ncbi:MAG: phosphatidate cytidylyltransferase [Deltaproteobacteria bacterium]
MHLKRWITAIVVIPFLILLVSIGGSFLLAVVINAAVIIALWEYFRIGLNTAESEKLNPQNISILSFQSLAFFTGSMVIWAAYFHSFKMVLCIISFNFIGCALVSFSKFKFDSSVLEIVFKQVLGVIYIPVFLSFLVLIRNGNDGISWIFFLLILVFVGDTAAYYAGTYFGRHKLCPAVSPNKTIEGSVGGLAANLVAGALFKYFFMPSLSWGLSLLCFFSIGAAGQVGDLFESELKRASHIKDSGTLFPGHGGILDRIDALLFAAPVAYFFKEYVLTG